MELCLMIEGQEGVTWSHWLALARTCEEHGISTLYRSDHYLNLDGEHPERGSLDAWATLSALAAVTTTIRLGTLVSPATFRHPSTLAKMVATADQISHGRIELGLGAGWHEQEHSAYGFEFPDARTRMEVLEEQLQIVLGNWSDGSFSFVGEHYVLSDLDAQPKPVQRPHPPLILGGRARPRSAALAARFADEYNIYDVTVEEAQERMTKVTEACEDFGRAPIPVSVMVAVVTGADDADLKRRVARTAEVTGFSAEQLLGEPPAGWIVGSLPEVAEELHRFAQLGIDRVICQHNSHEDLEFIALLGDHLAPLVT
jgi:F420-dependent oxidoreductase-like protein